MGVNAVGTDRLIQCRVATKLYFLQNAIPAKHNKAKYSQRRYARRLVSSLPSPTPWGQRLWDEEEPWF